MVSFFLATHESMAFASLALSRICRSFLMMVEFLIMEMPLKVAHGKFEQSDESLSIEYG